MLEYVDVWLLIHWALTPALFWDAACLFSSSNLSMRSSLTWMNMQMCYAGNNSVESQLVGQLGESTWELLIKLTALARLVSSEVICSLGI